MPPDTSSCLCIFGEIHTGNLVWVALRVQRLHLPWQAQEHQANNDINCQSGVRTGYIHGQTQDPEMIRESQVPRQETIGSLVTCSRRWFLPDPSSICQEQTSYNRNMAYRKCHAAHSLVSDPMYVILSIIWGSNPLCFICSRYVTDDSMLYWTS